MALSIFQLHFTPVFQIPPPDDPCHASLIAGRLPDRARGESVDDVAGSLPSAFTRVR